MKKLHLRVGLLALSLGMTSCATASNLRGRIEALRHRMDQAEQNGARRCAPRELAEGRAHAIFAETELDEGNYQRAEQEFDLASPNAEASFHLSPPERCNPREVAVIETPAPGPGDQDGDGILDPQDHCPTVPETYNGFQDEDGCPDDPDTDGDGIPDSADRCPVQPEDRDSYQDEDGCPEPDNDADGIPDTADRCLNEPEDYDSFQDTDGCPDPDNDQDSTPDVTDNCPNEAGPADSHGCPPAFTHIQVTAHGVRFYVEFDNNRAVLRPSAAATLDEVVRFLNLQQNRNLRYEVGGHTDSRGSARRNTVLSQQRAESVRVYLMGHGIDATRLVSRGYGPSQPIDRNTTAEGRQRNRRVELNEINASGQLVH